MSGAGRPVASGSRVQAARVQVDAYGAVDGRALDVDGGDGRTAL